LSGRVMSAIPFEKESATVAEQPAIKMEVNTKIM
jgi:hypothetical protein